MEIFRPQIDTVTACSGGAADYVVIAYGPDPRSDTARNGVQMTLEPDVPLQDFVEELRGNEAVGAITLERLCYGRVHRDPVSRPHNKSLDAQTELVAAMVFAGDNRAITADLVKAHLLMDGKGYGVAVGAGGKQIPDVLFLGHEISASRRGLSKEGRIIRARGGPLHVAVDALTTVVRSRSRLPKLSR